MSVTSPSASASPSRRSALDARGRLAIAALVVTGLGLGGCGDDDPAPSPSSTTGTSTDGPLLPLTTPVNGTLRRSRAATTSTDTVVVTPADAVLGTGVDRRRGLAFVLRREGAGIGMAVTVRPSAPAATRRALAKVSGYQVLCRFTDDATRAASIEPTGPRSGVPAGTVLRTGGFLRDEPGRTVVDTIDACFLILSSSPRGSTTQDYEIGPDVPPFAVVRFR